MRAYRAAPRAVAVLAPVPIVARPLLERAHEAFAGLQAKLPGRGAALGDASMSQVATAGGARGMGTAALAKILAVCAGTAGGAAACVTAGVVPAPPLGLAPEKAVRPHLERVVGPLDRSAEPEQVAVPAADPATEPVVEAQPEPAESAPVPEIATGTEAATPAAAAGPEPAAQSPTAAGASAGSPAGEFGP